MHPQHQIIRAAPNRRTFLVAGSVGFCGLHLPSPVQAAARKPAANVRKQAKSTILIWLSGGASHIDTWDLKPNAPAEYRGEFKPRPQHHAFDLPDARLIAPGQPDRSVLLHRIGQRGADFMPPLATTIVDRQAVELMQKWIQGLP